MKRFSLKSIYFIFISWKQFLKIPMFIYLKFKFFRFSNMKTKNEIFSYIVKKVKGYLSQDKKLESVLVLLIIVLTISDVKKI